MKRTTFVMACKLFFGTKPGQQLVDFKAELDALTPKDKQDMIEMFKTVDIDATMPSSAPMAASA